MAYKKRRNRKKKRGKKPFKKNRKFKGAVAPRAIVDAKRTTDVRFQTKREYIQKRIIPQEQVVRVRTKVYANFTAVAANASNHFYVYCNAYAPLQVDNAITNTQNLQAIFSTGGAGVGGAYTCGSADGQMPQGFQSLVGTGLYTRYTTLSMMCCVRMCPQLVGDTVVLACAPVRYNPLTATANRYTSVYTMSQGPFASTVTCSPAKEFGKRQWACSKFRVGDVIGTSQEEIAQNKHAYSCAYNTSGFGTSNNEYWPLMQVRWATLQGFAPSNPIGLEMILEYTILMHGIVDTAFGD